MSLPRKSCLRWLFLKSPSGAYIFRFCDVDRGERNREGEREERRVSLSLYQRLWRPRTWAASRLLATSADADSDVRLFPAVRWGEQPLASGDRRQPASDPGQATRGSHSRVTAAICRPGDSCLGKEKPLDTSKPLSPVALMPDTTARGPAV